MAEDDWDRPDLSEIWSKGGMLFDAAFDDSAAYIPLLDVQTTSAAFTSGQLIAPTSDPSSLFPASYVDTPAPTISTPSAFDSPSPSSDDVGLAKSRKRKRDLVNLTEPPRVLGSYGATSGVGTMMVFGPAQPRRSRYDEETRAEVARTRDHGACPRCRKHKSKCRRELYELCPRCRAVKNPLTLHMPCFLATLFEAQLFRDRPSVGHPLYVWRPGVYELQSAVENPQATLQVRLMQGLGETLTVDVALYRPQPGDKTTYTATFAFAEPITVELPPYCLADLDQAKQNMLAYVELSRDAYIDDLMGPDQLTSTVLTEARDFAALNPASTARKALNLLAADRIIERDWTMCEGDATGIPSLPSFDSPGGVRRPVTPIMDGQLDQLVIQGFLQPLRDELLEQMQTSINTDRRREHWYDIFLTTFVLLANAEQLLAHSRRNAIRHGAQVSCFVGK